MPFLAFHCMCLAVPGLVVSVEDSKAIVSYGSKTVIADCSLMPCKKGDFVIIANGFVMQVVPKQQAVKTLELLRQEQGS